MSDSLHAKIPPIEVEYRTQTLPFSLVSETYDLGERTSKKYDPITFADLPVTHIIDVYSSIDDGKKKGQGIFAFRYRMTESEIDGRDDRRFLKEAKYLVFDPENPFRYEMPVIIPDEDNFMREVENVFKSGRNVLVVAGTRRELWAEALGNPSRRYYFFTTTPTQEVRRYKTIRLCFDRVYGTILRRGSKVIGEQVNSLMDGIKKKRPDKDFFTVDLGEWTELEVMVDSKDMDPNAFSDTLSPRISFAQGLIEEFLYYFDMTMADVTSYPYPSMIRNPSLVN